MSKVEDSLLLLRSSAKKAGGGIHKVVMDLQAYNEISKPVEKDGSKNFYGIKVVKK
jgi:hypothetical protein